MRDSLLCPTDSFEGLGDDEDVVDTNPEEDEGDDGVSGGVEEAEHGADAVTKDHSHGNTRHGDITTGINITIQT